jgi:uncharacterized protein
MAWARDTILWIALLMMVAAALYSSVGHGGASAYLAIMALFSVAPEAMRPTALALNIVVASVTAYRFARNGQTNWRLLPPLQRCSSGGLCRRALQIAPEVYRPMVGVLLLLASIRLFWQPERLAERPVHSPSLAVSLPSARGSACSPA